MKGFYFFYLIAFFSTSLLCDAGNPSVVYRQAGYRQDNCLHNQWSYADSSQQSDYIYDSIFGKLIKQNVRQWNGSAWVPDYYIENTLDGQGNIITTTQYSWDSISNSYQNYSLVIKLYNQYHYNFSDTNYLWDANNNKWRYSTLSVSEYDTISGQSIEQIWDTLSQSWVNDSYESWIYNHHIAYTTTNESWLNGILNEGEINQYVFDTAGNELQFSGQYWDNVRLQWFNNFINYYTYDAKGNNIIEISQNWDTSLNSYYITLYDTSIYDSNSYLINEYFNNYNLNSPVEHYELIYINDSVGNNLIRTQYQWDSTSQTWVNLQRYSATYNNNHQRLSDTAEWWNDGEWQYINFFRYNYGINNMETLSEFYTWTTSWLLLERFNYAYDNFDNKVYDLFQFNYGGDTLSLSGSREYYYYEALDISNNTSTTPSPLCIYPDPASQTLNIALPEIYTNEPYTVYDLLGQTMTAGYLTGNNYTIDVSGYSDGLYVIRVNNLSQKFVVKR